MARARNIKPSFYTNNLLAECDPLARILFTGLWTLADREGRLEDIPQKIKVQILPYDECNCEFLLNQLHTRDFIVRYIINNIKYIQVINFSKHQHPHVKEQASTIPAPDKNSACPPLTLNPLIDSLNPLIDSPISGSLETVKKISKRKNIYSEEFEKFWNSYPPQRRKEKPDAYEKWKIAIRKSPPQDIISAVQFYCKTKEVIEGFSPHPAKWLKQERWGENYTDHEVISIQQTPLTFAEQTRIKNQQLIEEARKRYEEQPA